jgi:putative beta-lysine N-acetyltransferase
MKDKIETLGEHSIIQHGEHNRRVYLMKLDQRDFSTAIPQLNALAREHKYTKIFCKVPAKAAPLFFADGYLMEAYIPGFYGGTEAVCFMAKFLNSERLLGLQVKQLSDFNQLLMEQSENGLDQMPASTPAHVIRLNEDYAEEISGIYSEVFSSYPFPIDDPRYILKTMQSHVRYYGIKKGARLIALSSAEMDPEGRNAELTDFATLPEARGKKLSLHLLEKMEEEMRDAGLRTLYTIARLNSLPMNRTFLRRGYRYSGTLINNTNIAGGIESMNVLYKRIN